MTKNRLRPPVEWAVEAARNKKAMGVTVLDLAAVGAFTDAFVLCSGASNRQVQAISDEIEGHLGRNGVRLAHREGYDAGEWVLLDFRDFIVHVFHERARLYYDLERLWRTAPRTDLSDAPPGAAHE